MFSYNSDNQIITIQNDANAKINWKNLAKTEQLSEEFMTQYADQLNWTHISRFQTLSEDFIRNHADLLDWNAVSEVQKLSVRFLLEFADKIKWAKVTSSPSFNAKIQSIIDYKGNLVKLLQKEKVSPDFMRKYHDLLDWEVVSATQKFTEKYLEEFADKLNLKLVFQNNTPYTEETLRKYLTQFDNDCWTIIAQTQKLSEEFMREFQDKIDWNDVAKYQILSEAFIQEFADKLNWQDVSEFQTLSVQQMVVFADRIKWKKVTLPDSASPDDELILNYQGNLNKLLQKETVSVDFLRTYQDLLDWEVVSATQFFAEEHLLEFIDRLNLQPVLQHKQTYSEEILRQLTDKLNPECWKAITQHQTLSEDFIREFEHQVSWEEVAKSQTLSESFIQEFADKLNWNDVSEYQQLSLPQLVHFADRIKWKKIAVPENISAEMQLIFDYQGNLNKLLQKVQVSMDFLRTYQELLDWEVVSATQTFKEEDIQEFIDKLNLILVFKNQPQYTETTLRKLSARFDEECWQLVTQTQALSEGFIREFVMQISWADVAKSQILSETFIEEFADKLDWNHVSEFQQLSVRLLIVFADRIKWKKINVPESITAEEQLVLDYKGNLTKLLQKEQISMDFLKTYQDLLDWEIVSATQIFTEEYLTEFIEKLNIKSVLQHKQAYSESLLETLADSFDEECWKTVTQTQVLSEYFMRKFEGNIYWEEVAKSQTLSEEFIQHFADKLDWSAVSELQKLSVRLLIVFAEQIKWKKAENNPSVTPEIQLIINYKGNTSRLLQKEQVDLGFLRSYHDLLDWEVVSATQTFTEEQIWEFADNMHIKPQLKTGQAYSEKLLRHFISQFDEECWQFITKGQTLSESFMREFEEHIFWTEVAKSQTLSEAFIQHYADKLDWNAVSELQKLSVRLVVGFAEHIRWKKTENNPHLDAETRLVIGYKGNLTKLLQKEQVGLDFLRNYHDLLDWEVVSATQFFAEEDIWEFVESLNIKLVLQNKHAYSEKMLRKLLKDFDEECWLIITQNQKLSEEFIQEFEDKIVWEEVAKNQTLSEKFIEEYMYMLNWHDIKKYQQHLNHHFTDKYQKFKHEEEYACMTDNFLRELVDEKRLSWTYVSQYAPLTELFVTDFLDFLDFQALLQNPNLSKAVLMFIESKISDQKTSDSNKKPVVQTASKSS